jgi:N12 class adenine-specific DNA methylase
MSAPRFRPRSQDDLAPSGAQTRIQANLAALRVLRLVQAEARPATEDEQAVLARWSSWGAVPAVFLDSRDPDTGELHPAAARYANARAQLRDLLSPEEYQAARTTTINAHYTDHALATAMWTGLRHLGFVGGAVLEPGCGSGNFIGTAPAGASMVGVELDPTTAAIASLLYPDAQIRTESFADTPIAPGEFAAVIGNVPFGAGPVPLVLTDPLHNVAGHVMHNHFVIKSLDAVRPGGYVLVLTSRFTMDATADAARADMAERADLVGAIRLPERTHRRAAGTDVVTDLLVLRRREDDREPSGPAWQHAVSVDVQGTEVPINEYFAEHPEMVLGTPAVTRGQFTAQDFTVLPAAEADVAAELADTLAAVARRAAQEGLVRQPDGRSVHSARPSGVRIGGKDAARYEGLIVAHDDGSFGVVHHGVEQPHTVAPEQADELRALVGVRDSLTALLEAEAATAEDTEQMASLRAQLGERYDAYVAAYGPVNRFTWTPRLRTSTPAGQALRAGLIAAGHAWPSGGKLILRQDADTPEWARRETLLAHGHAVVKDGELRMRTTKAAKQVRTRLLADGYADVEGGTLAYTATGRALLLAASPEAVNRTRTTPDLGGFLTDPFAPAVLALEHFDPDSGTARKASIFTQRVIAPRKPAERVADPADAIAVSVDRVSRVDLDIIAELLGEASAEAARARLGELVYDEPGTDRLVPRSEYLSGNVRAKLAAAREAAANDERYAVNVAALKAVLPPDLDAGEIDARLGSPWLDADVIAQGLRHVLSDQTITVKRGVGASWQIDNGRWDTVLASEVYGTDRLDALMLASHLLEGRPIRVSADFHPDDGITRRRKAMAAAAEETLAAQGKAEELNAAFVDWLWSDPERAAALTQQYNTLFNSLVARSYDDAKPALPGLTQAITPRPHQLAAVARIVAEPTVLLAHEVGAGKTLEMVMGCMELRRLGLARKPAIVVPNHMVEQFSREFLQAYPRARVLSIAGRDLDKTQRTRTVARLATGDWDAVIMPRTVFERIPVSAKRQKAYLTEDLAEFDAWLKANADLGDARIVKRMVARREARAERIQRRVQRARDTGLCFEDTGIDYLMVDEAHGYKNREILSNNPELAIDGSIRAADLAMKLAYLRETHGQRVATFATATPISNSIAEMYGMLTYLGRDLLKEAGIEHFDAWAANHTEVVSDVEVSPDGGVRTKSRVASFRNCPEMLRVWRTIADVKTADDLKLPVPELVGGAPEIVAVPSSAEQVAFMAEISQRADQVRMRTVEPKVDNLLKISSDGRAAALDLRLVGEQSSTPGKLATAADRIAALWRAHQNDVFYQRDEGGALRRDTAGEPVPEEKPGSLQLVFCDIGTPSAQARKRGGWTAYQELRTLLVAHGLPAEAIRFMQDARTDQDKANLFAAARAGRVAVLIGSTELMGVGTNVQRRAVALHHLDCPWRPADVAQREGRILRQGNQHQQVRIIRYVTEGSFDAYMWQGIERKQGFISQVMKGQLDAREVENIDEAALSYSEVKALASGDIRLLAKAKADGEVRNLERLAASHRRSQHSLRGIVHTGQERLAKLAELVTAYDASIARRVDTRGANFRMTVGDTEFTERAQATAALMAALRAHHYGHGTGAIIGKPQQLGRLGGFVLSSRRDDHTVDLTLHGVTDLTDGTGIWVTRELVEDGEAPAQLGVITRLENRITGLDARRADALAWRDETQADVEQARAEIGKPFAKADALTAAKAKAAGLAKQLATATDPPAVPPPTADAATLTPDPQPAVGSTAVAEHGDTSADTRTPTLDLDSQRPPDQLASPVPDGASPAKPAYADRPSVIAAQRDIETALSTLLAATSTMDDTEPTSVARNLELLGAIHRLRDGDYAPEQARGFFAHLADAARHTASTGTEPLAHAATRAAQLIDEHCQRADDTNADLEAWRWSPTSSSPLRHPPAPAPHTAPSPNASTHQQADPPSAQPLQQKPAASDAEPPPLARVPSRAREPAVPDAHARAYRDDHDALLAARRLRDQHTAWQANVTSSGTAADNERTLLEDAASAWTQASAEAVRPEPQRPTVAALEPPTAPQPSADTASVSGVQHTEQLGIFDAPSTTPTDESDSSVTDQLLDENDLDPAERATAMPEHVDNPSPQPEPAEPQQTPERMALAVRLAERGFAVFPLRVDAKTPAVAADWEGAASTDPARVPQLWRNPDSNIGIATGPSHLVVIDLDVAKNPDAPIQHGETSLNTLAGERAIPATLTVRTPSGGRHLYFLAPDTELRNTAGKLGPLIDTRAAGGYVVAPGSVIDGKEYVIENDAPIAPLPDWLHQALAPTPKPAASNQPELTPAPTASRTAAYAEGAVTAAADTVRQASVGTRNATLNKESYGLGSLVSGGVLDGPTAERSLTEAGLAAGLPPDEVQRTITSGMQAGARRPRAVPVDPPKGQPVMAGPPGDPVARMLAVAEQAYHGGQLEQAAQAIQAQAAAWDATDTAAWLRRKPGEPDVAAYQQALAALRTEPDLPRDGDVSALAGALRRSAELHRRLDAAARPMGRSLQGLPAIADDLAVLRTLVIDCGNHVARLEATAEALTVVAPDHGRLSSTTHRAQTLLAALLREPGQLDTIAGFLRPDHIADPELRRLYAAALTLRQREEEITLPALAAGANAAGGAAISPRALAAITACGVYLRDSDAEPHARALAADQPAAPATPGSVEVKPTDRPALDGQLGAALDEVTHAVARARNRTSTSTADDLAALDADLARIQTDTRNLWHALTDDRPPAAPPQAHSAGDQAQTPDPATEDIAAALAEADQHMDQIANTREGNRIAIIRDALGTWWRAVSDATRTCTRDLFADTAFQRAVTTITTHAYQAISRVSFTLSARLSVLSDRTAQASDAMRRLHLTTDTKAAHLQNNHPRADFTEVVTALNALRRELAAGTAATSAMGTKPTVTSAAGPRQSRTELLNRVQALRAQAASVPRPIRPRSAPNDRPQPSRRKATGSEPRLFPLRPKANAHAYRARP